MIKNWQELHYNVLQSFGIRHEYGGKKEIVLNGSKWIIGVDLNKYYYDRLEKTRHISLYVHTENYIYPIDIKIDLKYNASWRFGKEFDYDFSGSFDDLIKQINEIA